MSGAPAAGGGGALPPVDPGGTPADAAPLVQPDPWAELRALTPARLALGRVGAHGLPTAEVLRFGLAHAQARDAVHVPLDVEAFERELVALGCATLRVASAAADRATYLMRPDLGRRLDADSAARLAALGTGTDAGTAAGTDAGADAGAAASVGPVADAASSAGAQAGAAGAGPARCELLLVVADGLSALAVQRHGPALVDQILRQAPAGWTIGPLVLATQARVALGDEVGQRLGARYVAVLIGERPGLGSADSVGVYLTAAPRAGRRDSERNCISNVRPAGLPPEAAARKLWWLLREAARRGHATGVALKDRSDETATPGDPTPPQSGDAEGVR